MPCLKCSTPPLCYLNYHPSCRRRRGFISTYHCHHTSVCKHQYAKQELQFNGKYKTIVAASESENFHPEAAKPSKPPFPEWKKWMVGLMLSIIIPSYRHKWGPLLILENKVDTAIETVETLTEAVEELSEAVEKVADVVEDRLHDDSKLKEVVESIEDLAKQTAEEAKLAEELIDKVKEVEEEVNKSLEIDDQEVKIVRSKKE